MPKPRKCQIAVDATPYYYCVSRCVRRAFLCGLDPYTQVSYEHRRSWVEQKILALGQVFCIDVCAYAVMSNHYHVVLFINSAKQAQLTDFEVLERWSGLFRGNLLVNRYVRGDDLCEAELHVVNEMAEQWRERLGNISWFMKVLNEHIAREANREDVCTGKFWEPDADQGFKSQALLDDKALAACLAYVDLNPMRAKMAESPETSEHTSAKKRIDAAKRTKPDALNLTQPNVLLMFIGNPREPMPTGLPFKLTDYLELLDWTGRILRNDKRGAIDQSLPPILERLKIDPKNWLQNVKYFETSFKVMAGSLSSVKFKCTHLGYQRVPATSPILS
ncbi:hypothetical protein ACFOND_10650 [Reinekea marina]|uniref:Transposase IS200-like domain-containing protein n=2 Tax=Reinekea marina TaxID=1310421 RepID=A0ABV7WSD8_9GAMM